MIARGHYIVWFVRLSIRPSFQKKFQLKSYTKLVVNWTCANWRGTVSYGHISLFQMLRYTYTCMCIFNIYNRLGCIVVACLSRMQEVLGSILGRFKWKIWCLSAKHSILWNTIKEWSRVGIYPVLVKCLLANNLDQDVGLVQRPF